MLLIHGITAHAARDDWWSASWPVLNFFSASIAIHPDLINLIFITVYIILILKFTHTKWPIYFIFLLHLACVFIVNGILIPANYMTDQVNYLEEAQYARRLLLYYLKIHPDYPIYWEGMNGYPTLYVPGRIFSLMPIPYIHSFYSIGMINIFIYSVIYLILKKMGILNGKAEWFFLLYPSLFIYNSLALRETLIMFFLLISVGLFIKSQPFLSILFIIPLAYIKFQILIIYFVSIIIYKIIYRAYINKIDSILLLISSSFVYYYSDWLTIDSINVLIKQLTYNPSNNADLTYMNILLNMVTNIPFFLMAPLPWQAHNLFQIMQSIENIAVLVLIVLIIVKIHHKKLINMQFYFINIFFVISILFHSAFIYNYGTISRYRFQFILMYLIYMYYIENKRNHSEPF
ncbi:MAG: hypothetical protein H7833_16810 [Magnetococcus sp. DMHC-1]